MTSSGAGRKAGAGGEVSTSYEVFQKHIGFGTENSVVDVSKVFSQECFVEWMSTRPGKKVKHPAQSYQRVLYAHIRGADRRRCFPEEVEKELLRLLRDIHNNPWNDLFTTHKIFFGRRGFKSKGYHESLRKEPEQNESSKKRRMDEKSIISKTDEPTKENSSQISNAVALRASINKLETIYLKKAIREAPRNILSPWDLMMSQLAKYVPVVEQGLCLETAMKRNLNLMSPAIQYFLNEMVDPNDIRFSREFLHPSKDEQFFRDDRPVACVLYRQDTVIFKEDLEASRIFRGSLVGKNWTELFVSLVSLFYSMIEHLPLLFETGSVWRRDLLRRNDGSRMVCLFKMDRLGSLTFMYFQEQTDLFPGVVNKNYFI